MNSLFNKTEDVIQFLLETEDWQDWEVIKLQMSSNSGVRITLNTKINDPSGKKDYQILRKLKAMIQSFINDNQGPGISLDIKLRLPKELRASFDDNGNYFEFFVDFFSAGNLYMTSTSQVEKTLSAPNAPVIAWEDFIHTKVNTWKNKHNYNNPAS